MAGSELHPDVSADHGAGRRHTGVPITREQIENYIAHQREESRMPESVQKYARNLWALYSFLPEEKRIRPETLTQWRETLL